jgi:hypothetical protein
MARLNHQVRAGGMRRRCRPRRDPCEADVEIVKDDAVDDEGLAIGTSHAGVPVVAPLPRQPQSESAVQ